MQQLMQQLNGLVQSGQLGAAEDMGQRMCHAYPDRAEGWIQLARISQMKGDSKTMLAHAEQAVIKAPNNVVAQLQEAEALLLCRRSEQALAKLSQMEADAARDPKLLQHIAELYVAANHHDAAMRCYKQAHTIVGDDAGLLYNTANAAISLGDIDEAEALLDKVIAQNPDDYDAYYNRATYRRQTAGRNHIPEMLDHLESGLMHPAGLVQMGYALAKEYEDLGDHDASFEHLKAGADCRRKMLSYDVKEDVATMQHIRAVMDADFLRDVETDTAQSGAVFILGLPRSGTTLVDRILSSHLEVESLGEINDFALAMMDLAPQASSKEDLIAKTIRIDFTILGTAYRASTKAKGNGAPSLIDKTPANFLYIGLIAKALPHAKIIHLRRHPMDSCYAIYKTLFRMGYPFSYDLDDLAEYYVAYHDLMDHWRSVLPGRVLDIAYEDIIADQEGASRQIVDHCGLAWEDACLEFHKNTAASATASAAQVRQPIYTSSVQKWKNYEQQLAPLKARLISAGIKV